MQGRVWGYGRGAPGYGQSGKTYGETEDDKQPGSGSKGSSGGGPPVKYGSAGYGADEEGSGKGKGKGKSPSELAKEAARKITGSSPNVPQEYDPEDPPPDPPKEKNKKSNTPEEGNPMPYTGSGHWGNDKPRDPGTIGGATEEIRESGNFAPVVMKGGKSGGGGSNAGDDPSIWDDGNWYGGIFGGGYSGSDPDNPDYYTPNVLENTTKK
jgi:hypothetical protein